MTRRWTNQSLPQTLQIAVMLFYASAIFGVLFGYALTPIGLLLAAGEVGAGLGLASEKKWGYRLAVAITVLGLVPLVVIAADGIGELLDPGVLLYAVFQVARFALVVHPMSRQYQRIWFD